MTTNELPWSEWSDIQETGSQAIPATPPNPYLARSGYLTRDRFASNDASYEQEVQELMAAYQRNHQALIVDRQKDSDQDDVSVSDSQKQNQDNAQSGATIINFNYQKPAQHTKFQRASLFADKDFADKTVASITSMEDIEKIDDVSLQASAKTASDQIDKLKQDALAALESKENVLCIADLEDDLDNSAHSAVTASLAPATDSDPIVIKTPVAPPLPNQELAFDYKRASSYKKAPHHDVLENQMIDDSLTFEPVNNKNNHNNNQDFVILANNPVFQAPTQTTIPERVFMNSLMKHTFIALAIIIPLAAFTAYAATPNTPMTANSTGKQAAMVDIKPSDIIYNPASAPTTVDNVDLAQYAGTWFEIGRLPMSFQKKCASDVTATYTPNTDGSIQVLNACAKNDGTMMSAKGQAKPVDASGSKLKVTFLPSWIRWLPVGRADYWVLARDGSYQTALVGTPNQKYLWLLARTPNISQDTYTKYRQIAQQQGYDLASFTLTPHSGQSVQLSP